MNQQSRERHLFPWRPPSARQRIEAGPPGKLRAPRTGVWENKEERKPLMKLRHLFALVLLVLAPAPHASAQVGLRETFGPGRNGPVGGIASGDELQRKIVDQQAFPL